MNTVVLYRRLIYIVAMVLLIIPIRMLGEPAIYSGSEDEGNTTSGGALARIRAKHDLGQADLGEIDPASDSMRLATLGLRGVACTILWNKAEEYKREKYWDRLAATLNQIAVLQPHFIKVWEFQSHNLSYNVSTEFDNYKHRYEWVKKGIDYLITGSRYNKHRTELPYELGWFFGNKMGIADEQVQYRALYREDSEFHEEILDRSGVDLASAEGQGPDKKPDNWKSGRLWYERAYAMVRRGDRPARSAMMFYRMGAQWLMKHAEYVQKDRDAYAEIDQDTLEAYSRQSWRNAQRAWTEFGDRSIDTTFGDTIRLNELKQANEDYRRMQAEFNEFCGEVYSERYAQREALLTEEQRVALTIAYKDRTFEQVIAAEEAQSALAMDPNVLAKAMPDETRIQALEMAKNLRAAKDRINHVEIYQNQINFNYWAQRCVAEQLPEALAARRAMYNAEKQLELGELDAALKSYDVAWTNWDRLFNRHPALMIDEAGDRVLEQIARYQRLLDEPTLPPDFALKRFVEFREVHDQQETDPALMNVVSLWQERYPGRDFLDEMAKKNERMQELLSGEEEAGSPDSPIAPAIEPTPVQVNQPVDGIAPAPAPTETTSTETPPSTPAEPEEKKPAEMKLDVTAPVEGTAPAPVPTEEGTPESNTADSQETPEETAPEPATEPQNLDVKPPVTGEAPVPVEEDK